jgi:quinohemoprotein amine dehydrogenase
VTANWSVDNFDERAKAANDVKFAGVMEPHGQFLPAFAGPNPARGNLNNVGDLSVRATFDDGGRAVAGSGRLVVAVQRWNTPPLR